MEGEITEVRQLTRENFISPPRKPFAACAHETKGRFGELISQVQPITRGEYRRRFLTREDFSLVHNVGEPAGSSGCGGLAVYDSGVLVEIGVQKAGLRCPTGLVSLARVVLRRLWEGIGGS
jgi:hypothetical protein